MAERTNHDSFPSIHEFRAYPSKGFGGHDDETNHEGVDVLDYFAAFAIGGVIQSTPPPMSPSIAASTAYDIAAAMLAESITRHAAMLP